MDRRLTFGYYSLIVLGPLLSPYPLSLIFYSFLSVDLYDA